MQTHLSTSENFSLSAGGPFDNALIKMGMQNKPKKLALLVLCITWLPIAIISAIEGTLFSGCQLPFLKDVAMQGRILVALPILIVIRFIIDNKVSIVLKYISDSLMSREEQQLMLNKALNRAKKLTSSALTETILLLIVIATTISFVKVGVYSGLEGEKTSWIASANSENHSLSVAGYWALIISIPMVQFLTLRWLWRYFVWILLLFRLSKAKLNLLPTHADRSGGLGIIILAQKNFNLIFLAGSVVISGQFIAQLNEQPEIFNTLRSEAIGYIIFSLILIIFPLLFFIGQLTKTKNDGLLYLSNLGATLSRKFEREWVNNLQIEKEIEEKQVDPSMIYDYAGMYDNLQQLRVVPVTPRDIISMGVLLIAPFIPILFIHFSVAELVKRIAGLLL